MAAVVGDFLVVQERVAGAPGRGVAAEGKAGRVFFFVGRVCRVGLGSDRGVEG